MNVALWVVVPYVALTVFLVGHVWRWRVDQFGWTTHTTQLLESRLLRWGSPLFHIGLLLAVGGHALGLLVPKAWTEAVGISEHTYHLVSVTAGTVAGVLIVAGFALLLARRLTNRRVRGTTSRMDVALFTVLAVVILLGMGETVLINLLGGGYDYRATVSVWYRGIFRFQPGTELMARAPLVYQLHALSAWVLIGLWPFTRLVHVWSVPLAYLWRPYVIYRRRTRTPAPAQGSR